MTVCIQGACTLHSPFQLSHHGRFGLFAAAEVFFLESLQYSINDIPNEAFRSENIPGDSLLRVFNVNFKDNYRINAHILYNIDFLGVFMVIANLFPDSSGYASYPNGSQTTPNLNN